MAEPSTASMFFGICGIAAAIFLFFSPVPTCRRICAAKSTQSFSVLPYVAQVVESSWWALWAIAKGNRLEMLLNNVIGVSIMFCYVVVFAMFAAKGRKARIFGQMAVAAVLIACGVLVAIFVDKDKDMIFGITAVTFNCLKYASPLSVARLVIRTQSVEFMPLPLTLAGLSCGVFWGLHGLFLEDLWIIGPNMAGVAFGIVQIALYARYYKRKEAFGDAQAEAVDGMAIDETMVVVPEDVTLKQQCDSDLQVVVDVPADVAVAEKAVEVRSSSKEVELAANRVQ